MATTQNYIEYVCEQIRGIGLIRYRKMFGEYLVYINEKPILIICDNTSYVKKLDCIEQWMKDKPEGYPYKGAKAHYILDIDDANFSKMILSEVEKVTEVPKKKEKKADKTA